MVNSDRLNPSIQIEQCGQGDVQGFCNLQKVQIGRISTSRFQPAHVGPIENTFGGEVFLRPILGLAMSPNVLAKSSWGVFRAGARRHAPMVTMGHTLVYRPGSTRRSSMTGCVYRVSRENVSVRAS